ncbi:hypothetical protein [Yoonia sp. BS5-3]|uniref:Uncharacterized protein n=1 Tax=Yoonia phaeophyticola TaxID=3137369 RepID=A0ABZ2V7N5_9RHOB
MTDKEQQESFAARLQRIESGKQGDSDAPTPPKAVRPVNAQADGSAPDSLFIRNTLIWLGIIICAAFGSFVGFKALPDDLKNTVATITGMREAPSEDQIIADKLADIVENDVMSFFGPTAQPQAVAQLNGDLVDLTQVATNISFADDTTEIGQVRPFARNASCNLRRPLPNEKLVNIRVENGTLPAPLQAFSASALSDQLMRNVTAVTQNGAAYDQNAQVTGAMSSIDVFLTDNTAPLYLALQNMGNGIVWNIHAAPGVTVAHVAIVSSEISGLANIAPTTTFDALLVSDFVPADQVITDDQSDCMVRPWRNPQPDWIGSERAAAGDSVTADQLQTYTAGYIAYDRWFSENFGVDASTDVIALRETAHVLYGDIPEQPIAYQSLAGQDIHLMRTDHVLTGDTQSRTDAVNRLHQQTLLAAVGADIGALNPAPVERRDLQ